MRSCPYRPLYLAGDALAAKQWEAHLALPDLQSGRRVLDGERVERYSSLVSRMLLACPDAAGPSRLGARQCAALWRRIVEESAEGDSLLDGAAASRWAADAWRLVHAWRMPLSASDAERLPELAAFMRWSDRYRDVLVERRWADASVLDDHLLRALQTRPPNSQVGSAVLALADFAPTPAQTAVLSCLGAQLVVAPEGERRGVCRKVEAADPDDELWLAAQWAAAIVHQRPGARVALVIGDLAARVTEVRRALEAALPDDTGVAFTVPDPQALDGRPWLGAALTSLELLGPAASFGAFSRWLRSPFFLRDEAERDAAAAFELEWRADFAAQLPFDEAYRQGGLRERLLARWPQAVARLDAAFTAVNDSTRTRLPAEWAEAWYRALTALDWRAATSDGDADDDVTHLERALREMAGLGAITGAIGPHRALSELEDGLRTGLAAGPWPLAGVAVVTHLQDVGPGYDAVWVAGASEDAFPYPVRLNPLLPAAVQRDHGLPWSTPADARRRTRALLDRLVYRAGEIVFSWPLRVLDEPSAPSPWVSSFESLERQRVAASAPALRNPGLPVETVDDDPPALDDTRLAGGTAVLDAQAACPLHAFCRYRLGARPLPRVQRGVATALQGRIVHHALERLFRRFPDSASLAAASDEQRTTVVQAAAQAATLEVLGRPRASLGPFIALEIERTRRVLERLVPLELRRAPYRVIALEEAYLVEFAGMALELRMDRIDELESEDLAIVDYKSGSSPRVADWFLPRPRNLQLPIYALVGRRPVGALAVASVRPEKAGYAGIWAPDDAFPGRSRRDPEGRTLAALMAHWQAAVERLVAEYVAGDTRCFIDEAGPAGGDYAVLTRVYEQLELHDLANDLGAEVTHE